VELQMEAPEVVARAVSQAVVQALGSALRLAHFTNGASGTAIRRRRCFQLLQIKAGRNRRLKLRTTTSLDLAQVRLHFLPGINGENIRSSLHDRRLLRLRSRGGLSCWNYLMIQMLFRILEVKHD
jgi:hypothetical protein